MHPHWEHEGHQIACDHWWTHQTQIGGSQENLWFVLLKWWFSAVLSSTPSMQMSLKHMPSLICRPNDSSFWQLLRVSSQPENSLRESLVFWVPIQEAEPQFSGRSATQLNQENVCLAKNSRFASSPLSTKSLLIKEDMEWLSPGVEPLPIVAPIVAALLHVLFPDTRDFLIWEIACCSFSAGNNQNYGHAVCELHNANWACQPECSFKFPRLWSCWKSWASST